MSFAVNLAHAADPNTAAYSGLEAEVPGRSSQ